MIVYMLSCVYVITHGFTKKTDKIPENEKKRAREIRKKFMEE